MTALPVIDEVSEPSIPIDPAPLIPETHPIPAPPLAPVYAVPPVPEPVPPTATAACGFVFRP